MKISKHGQVTIPHKFRHQLGFEPNTEIEFIPDGGALILVKKQSGQDDGVSNIYGRKSFSQSTDDLMKFLRG